MHATSIDLVGRLYTQVSRHLEDGIVPLALSTRVPHETCCVSQAQQVWWYARLFRKFPRQREFAHRAQAGAEVLFPILSASHQISEQCAGIYALSEYFLATRDPRGLEFACATFDRIQQQDYRDTRTQRLAAYTVLFAASQDDIHGRALRETVDRIARQLTGAPASTSYGQTLEVLWLMRLALETLGADLRPFWELWSGIATHALQHGVDWERGGIHGDALSEHAEALVGFLDAYELFGDDSYLEAFEAVWRCVAPQSLLAETEFHTGRALIECAERLERLK